MTTPLNSFQDILDALESNPTLKDQLRRHVLTEELLQLPAQFLVLQGDVRGLQGDVAELKTGQVDLQVRMGRVEGRVGNIDGNLYEQRAVNRIIARADLLGIKGEPGWPSPRPVRPVRNSTMPCRLPSGPGSYPGTSIMT